ncbi:hypothetical protein [Corynebacterium sp. HMSC078H07]|uniref:hypothetical protein n=1 Tax=Corynebacterium sp. HMSC078H07 TaxID=1739379 RepID=UPI0008A44FEA|nr:hypothetical protein [Corynebacterium sp. HMSC078H07]OFR62989.1 hypothetical protein HMPREF2875_03435 [Corynebacterium sp. HMSC078H07]
MGVKSKQIIAVWIAVVLAVVAVVVTGWWVTERQQVSEGALTVKDVVDGGVPQDQSLNAYVDPAEQDRIVALAEALGIPAESVPRGILSVSSDVYRSRQILKAELDKAVANNKITKEDAAGTLAAFDAGLVTPAMGPIVAESNPAQ